MVEIKTDAALETMREAGRVVAHALEAVRTAAAVGVGLRELDEAARTVLTTAGARSPFLGYQPAFAPTPFPAVICASVNDAVVHGVPNDYRLRDGDLVSIDCGAELDGWTGDAAISFTVGTPRPADLTLIAATQQALDAGIAAATVGHRIGDISHAISTIARTTSRGALPSSCTTRVRRLFSSISAAMAVLNSSFAMSSDTAAMVRCSWRRVSSSARASLTCSSPVSSSKDSSFSSSSTSASPRIRSRIVPLILWWKEDGSGMGKRGRGDN